MTIEGWKYDAIHGEGEFSGLTPSEKVSLWCKKWISERRGEAGRYRLLDSSPEKPRPDIHQKFTYKSIRGFRRKRKDLS